MTTPVFDSLGELTGEELYNLLGRLADAQSSAAVACAAAAPASPEAEPLQALLVDMIDAFMMAAAQVARIPVSVREAAQLVYRSRYMRGHPVRVPGT